MWSVLLRSTTSSLHTVVSGFGSVLRAKATQKKINSNLRWCSGVNENILSEHGVSMVKENVSKQQNDLMDSNGEECQMEHQIHFPFTNMTVAAVKKNFYVVVYLLLLPDSWMSIVVWGFRGCWGVVGGSFDSCECDVTTTAYCSFGCLLADAL